MLELQIRTSAEIWVGLQRDIKPIEGLPQPKSMADLPFKLQFFEKKDQNSIRTIFFILVLIRTCA